MAIVVAGGFKVNNNESVDNRIVLTKTQMKTFNDVNLPDVYFAICKGETDDDTDPDIGKMFLYNKNNDVDESNDSLKEIRNFLITEVEQVIGAGKVSRDKAGNI